MDGRIARSKKEIDMVPLKILLDTDIGSDIDDAVCLAYLLAQPACDLVGITTVTGEGEQRARLVSALCKAAGRDVPIFPGAEVPFLIPARQTHAPQALALGGWPHDTGFRQGEAVRFLRDTIRANPGAITLLTIGPLTNIALLFAIDPEIPALLKNLVMMGGHFANRFGGWGPLEWNIILDPHAAQRVFQSPVAIRAVGTEITSQVTMPAQEVRERFQVGLLRPVRDFAEVWFEERDLITFHDPLAAVSIFDEDVCAFERGTASVELTSERLQGFTHWQRDGNGRHEVAVSVDPARFFAHFFAVFA
jgi:purine nucleosidase